MITAAFFAATALFACLIFKPDETEVVFKGLLGLTFFAGVFCAWGMVALTVTSMWFGWPWPMP